jgi:serine/threonine protein kinase
MFITQRDERYEIERELGSGAFGVAYLARDTENHSRRVVIKVLLEAEGQSFDDASFRIRFERETKALALIDHPYVVHVYEHGWTLEGRPYIVMQYVKGKSLRKAMRGRGMELGRAARIVEQLGSALSAVHAKGVVHRDLKPENVMLQSSHDDEFAILIDFGVATVEETRARRRGQETWAGTPDYMAPEQLRSRPCPASDVWALGVVAYELATGRRPFTAADVRALSDTPRAAVITGLKALRPELPEAAQAVILKALSYDPALRYAHAHEMGKAFLQAVSDGIPTRPGPTQPVSETLTELLQRCQVLFESLDQFRNPDSLHAFFSITELGSGKNCIGRAARLEFDQLLNCLYCSGRDYQGQALIDLLSALATQYSKDHRGQQFERLGVSLKRLLEQPPAAGR